MTFFLEASWEMCVLIPTVVVFTPTANEMGSGGWSVEFAWLGLVCGVEF